MSGFLALALIVLMPSISTSTEPGGVKVQKGSIGVIGVTDGEYGNDALSIGHGGNSYPMGGSGASAGQPGNNVLAIDHGYDIPGGNSIQGGAGGGWSPYQPSGNSSQGGAGGGWISYQPSDNSRQGGAGGGWNPYQPSDNSRQGGAGGGWNPYQPSDNSRQGGAGGGWSSYQLMGGLNRNQDINGSPNLAPSIGQQNFNEYTPEYFYTRGQSQSQVQSNQVYYGQNAYKATDTPNGRWFLPNFKQQSSSSSQGKSTDVYASEGSIAVGSLSGGQFGNDAFSIGHGGNFYDGNKQCCPCARR